MPLNVWIVRDAEPLPIDGPGRRLMRDGMLAAALVEAGHNVRWFTSTFDHYMKRQRDIGRQTVVVSPNYHIEILPADGYAKNVSLRRVWHNRQVARAFVSAAAAMTRPDIIVTDIPTTEAASAVIRLAKEWSIPSVVSVRDLWPDFFHYYLPPLARPFSRLLLSVFDRQVRSACSSATALIGISPAYLKWGLAKGRRQPGPLDAVIPLGYPAVQASEMRSAQRDQFLNRLGIEPHHRVATFIGSWGRTYDLATLLLASARLGTKSGLRIVIAGDGEQRADLSAQLSTHPNVSTPGWLNREEISWLLHRSDIGLLPYKSNAPQGLPNKLFEYMAFGVYQVSTLSGETADVLKELDIGLSCAPADAAALADTINAGLQRAEDQSIRPRILSTFAYRFEEQKVYRGFVEHLENIVAMSHVRKL